MEYEGNIWGSLPADYPTVLTEQCYRKLLDAIPVGSYGRELMGYGFKGVAYRFRATSEYQREFECSISAPGGAAPPADEEFLQERCLFGIFTSGLASLESLTFAIHALAGHYEPGYFSLERGGLRNVSPAAVSGAMQKWPAAPIAQVLGSLISDSVYAEWKDIRNILSHRVVPPRLISIQPGRKIKTYWHLTKAQFSSADESLHGVTAGRRIWLAKQLTMLWQAIDSSFPPRRNDNSE